MTAHHRGLGQLVAVLAITSLLSAATRPCLAEPPAAVSTEAPSDEAVVEQRRIEAKYKYQQGADAYAAGHFKDAVDLFLAADHLAPSAPLSFNIARAYEKLGDGSGALRWYRDYLRRNPAAPNADTVRTLITMLALELAKKGVQQLSVLSSPEGATITMDDQPLGVAPWTGELAPGKHHVLLTRRGYADTERDIDLPARVPIDVSVRLEPAAAAAPAAPPATSPAVSAVALTPPAPSAAPTRARGLGPLPWISLGAGAAALGGALTFELLRRSAETDAKNASTQIAYQADLDREQGRQTAARVFLGVGGALVVAGGVMWLLDSRLNARSPSAGLLCLPRSCAISVGGRF